MALTESTVDSRDSRCLLFYHLVYVRHFRFIVRRANKKTAVLNSGFGKHIEVAGLHGATVFAQELYISEICYTVTISCVKYSILAFYWRLFSVSNIRLPIYILTALTTGWGVACVSQLFHE